MSVKIRIILILFVILCSSMLILFSLRSPFMFSDIKEISKLELYKTPEYLKITYNINFTQDLKKNNLEEITKYFEQYLVVKNRDFSSDMITVTKATQNIVSYGNLNSKYKHRNLENILDISGEFRIVCSEFAKVSTIFWQLLGYKSRVIWSGNHVLTEVYNDNLDKWILVDSDGGVYAKNDGKLLNFSEAREFSKRGKNIFLDINTNNLTSNMKYNIDLYARTKFFVLIDSKDLFDFHIKFRDPLYILEYIFLNTKDEINGLQSSEPSYQKLGNKEIL